jgi:hypothetical protein
LEGGGGEVAHTSLERSKVVKRLRVVEVEGRNADPSRVEIKQDLKGSTRSSQARSMKPRCLNLSSVFFVFFPLVNLGREMPCRAVSTSIKGRLEGKENRIEERGENRNFGPKRPFGSSEDVLVGSEDAVDPGGVGVILVHYTNELEDRDYFISSI